MLSKEELLAKDTNELVAIANQLGAEYDDTNDKEKLVYSILDKQAMEGSKHTPAPKRRRTRIKDTSKVYSVNGKEGENFDTNKNIKPVQQPLFKDVKETKTEENKEKELTPEEILASIPKHRGRKTKAEKEAIAAAEAAIKARDTKKDDDSDVPDFIKEQQIQNQIAQQNQPVEEPKEETPTEEVTETLATELSNSPAKQEARQPEEPAADNGIWSDDPGDGTDFIVVNDLPVEDQAMITDYDMLDRPTTPQHEEYTPIEKPATRNENHEQEFDFSGIITGNGVLEVMPDGYGFLRSSDFNYLSSPDDIYVPVQQVRQYGLKTGDVIACHVRPPHDGEKYFPLTSIDMINGRNPQDIRDRVAFEHLTPLFPDEKFNLCGDPATTNLSTRIVDLFAPIGKGQRSLIVAQPKTGKTILMKNIANAIAANHPEAYLMMLLIDERPEEVTDMARTVNAEVIASTFDEPADHHVKIAGIVLEKAKRLVECGHDVVIFLDSITRLARAYNTVAPASGKVLTGGVDANALQKPKRFFGAARNIEGGGSLTIIATALIDTGSKMDEVIFEEFKGTGNMELQLERNLSNKRMFPAVNLVASSTRRDDLLQDQTTLGHMNVLRDNIADMNSYEAMKAVSDKMRHTKNNAEFLMAIND